jgi:hypothetical protein
MLYKLAFVLVAAFFVQVSNLCIVHVDLRAQFTLYLSQFSIDNYRHLH